MSLRNLLVLLACLAAVFHYGTAIECYVCGSSIDEANAEKNKNEDEGSCASLADDNTQDSDTFESCTITYGTGGNGMTSVSRGASLDKITEDYCEGDTCYCTGDKCNSDVISVPRTINCYACDTIGMFDNGCSDDVFDSSHKYMAQISGCSACGKYVTHDEAFGVKVSRGCARTVHNEDVCMWNADGSKYCVCSEGLCNNGRHLRVTVGSLAVAICLSVAKYFF